MSSSRSSSDILKAAHKLDKYLMKGEKEKTGSTKHTRKPTPTKDADDIEDPLSMPSVGENNSDDDVIITNATKRKSSDTISTKFAKFKRKPQPSSGSAMAKKPKITAKEEESDEVETEEIERDFKEIKKQTTTPTPPPRQPKKVSAVAMLKDDDDDDDVLNFTALEGVRPLLLLYLIFFIHLYSFLLDMFNF